MPEDYAFLVPMPWCVLRSLAVAFVVGVFAGCPLWMWVAWRRGEP